MAYLRIIPANLLQTRHGQPDADQRTLGNDRSGSRLTIEHGVLIRMRGPPMMQGTMFENAGPENLRAGGSRSIANGA